MRSVRVLRNVLTNYLRFFASGLLGFLITPILVHALGDGDYGLWVMVFSFTGYFGLFDQGIRPSLVRYVSRDHARGDHLGLGRTTSSAVALYAAVGLLTLGVSAVVAARFGDWFRVTPEQLPIAREVVLLAGASVAIGFPLGVFGAVLSGLQRYDVANGIGIGISVLRAAAFVAVLRLGGGLVGLAWTSLAVNLLGYGLSWIAVRRLLPTLSVHPRLVTRGHLGMVGSYSGIAFLGALATSVTFQTDSIVITAFLGAALVTPFALAAGLVENARALVNSATWVLAPTASELETKGESDKLHALLVAGSKYSVLLSWPVLLALVVFGGDLLETWVGPAYRSSAAGLLTLLALPSLLALPQSTASSLLFGVSRHKGVVALSLLNAGLNLGLSLLWVRPFGLVGVALGTALPLLVVGGAATLVYASFALGVPVGRYLLQGLVRPGLLSLVFLGPAVAVERLWHPVGWWALGASVAGCWLPYAAVAWRYGVTGEERVRWGRMVPGLFGAGKAAAAGAGS